MKVIVFAPVGHHPKSIDSQIESKITPEKLIQGGVQDRGTIDIYQIREIGGELYGSCQENDFATEENLLPFLQLRYQNERYAQAPMMILFCGHSTPFICNPDIIYSDGRHGFYLMDHMIKIVECIYGAQNRRHFHAELNKVSLLFCYGGSGYNIKTNRVMKLCHEMQQRRIGCQISGAVGSYGALLSNAGGIRNVRERYLTASVPETEDCCYDPRVYSNPSFAFTKSEDFVASKSIFVGHVSHAKHHHITYAERNFFCLYADHVRPESIAVNRDAMWRHTSLDMTNPYTILAKHTQYKCLIKFKEVIDLCNMSELIAQSVFFPSQFLQEPTTKINYYRTNLNVFLTKVNRYISYLNQQNSVIIEQHIELLQDLKSYILQSNIKSLNLLYEQILDILFVAGQQYRDLRRGDLLKTSDTNKLELWQRSLHIEENTHLKQFFCL